MDHLSHNELKELKAALEKERRDLEKELREHGRKVAGNWQGTPEGFKETDSAPEDTADRMEELAINVSLVEELERRLKDVVDALEKMSSNTYGICEKTGDPIPSDRLRANPAARVRLDA